MSSANLANLSYVAESTYGVIPTSPVFKRLRYRGESLNYAITNTTTQEIRSDRTQTDLIQTDAQSSGDINFELSFLTFDDFLEAVLCGTWAAMTGNNRELVNGTTLKSFTMQKHFSDAVPAEYHNFPGCVIAGMNMSFEVGSIISGAFQVQGLPPVTGARSGQSYTAANTNKPMNGVSDFSNFNVDGVPYTGCVTSLSLQIANNIRPIKCLGTLGPKEMVLGTFEVTGSMNLYFKEGSNYAKYLAGTEFPFNFRVADNQQNKYTFYFPRVKFESAQVVAGGQNTDVIFQANWRALYSGTSNHVMRIFKDPYP